MTDLDTLQTAAASMRLLVVDDDTIQRTILARLGSKSGFERVVSAATFQDAAEALQSFQFDCVTLDLSLGEHSGAMLLQSIARIHRFASVLVVSGAEEHVLRSTVALARSLNLKAQAFPKPLDLGEVRSALERCRQAALVLRALNEISPEAAKHIQALSG